MSNTNGYKSLLGQTDMTTDTLTVNDTLEVDSLIVDTTLNISNATVSMTQYDNSTITFSNNQLSVPNGGINTNQLANGAINDTKIASSAAINATKIATGTVTNTNFGYLSGVNSALYGCNDVETMTNKTINVGAPSNNTITNLGDANIESGAAINATKIGNGTVTNTQLGFLSTTGSAVYGCSDSETMTNKTINAANNTIMNLVDSNIDNTAAINATKIGSGSVNNTQLGYLSTAASAVYGCNDIELLKNKFITYSSCPIWDPIVGSSLYLQTGGWSSGATVDYTCPQSSDTVVLANYSQTLTNKTIRASNNTITNITDACVDSAAGINVSKLANGTITNTEFEYLSTVGSALHGDSDNATLTHKIITSCVLNGPSIYDATSTHNYALPTISTSDTIALLANTQTLTNKTINGSNNTITNVSLTSGVTGVLPSANGGSSRVLIATVTASGSSTTMSFSSIPSTYVHLELVIMGQVTSSGPDTQLTVNGVSSGYDDIVFYEGNIGSPSTGYSVAASCWNVGPMPYTSANATPGMITIEFPFYTNTSFNKICHIKNGYIQQSSSNNRLTFGYGSNRSTSAISSITITAGSGNWATNSVANLYGLI